jgi:hypothetical protein
VRQRVPCGQFKQTIRIYRISRISMGPLSVIEWNTSLELVMHPRVVQPAKNCAVWRCKEEVYL